MTSIELTEWKRKVILLHYAEFKLKRYFKAGKINSKEEKEIKKQIDYLWIEIWKYYPDNNPSVEQSFKLNFN